MRHFRCKCGKRTAMGSDSPAPCDGCPDCNTTLESHPDHHTAPEPHRWGEPEWEIDKKSGNRWRMQHCQNTYCQASRRADPEPFDGPPPQRGMVA